MFVWLGKQFEMMDKAITEGVIWCWLGISYLNILDETADSYYDRDIFSR